MIKNWHIVVTRSRFEKKCNTLLELNGIESFLPMRNVLVKYSDRNKWVSKPLFPGYIFVKFSTNERFLALSIDGMARIVRFENKDYIVNESVINGVKNRLSENKELELISTSNLVLGAKIKIIDGPFAGTNGVLIKAKGKSKILVEIEAINQGFLLELSENSISKIL